MVTANGANLQVYPPLANGGFNTGGLANLSLTTAESAPNATTDRADHRQPAGERHACRPDAPFSPTDPNSYNNTTSLTVYDSLGAAHTASLYFTKGDTAPNNWTAQLYVDGNAVGTPQAADLTRSGGALTTPANGTVAFPAYTPATGADRHEHDLQFQQHHAVRRQFRRHGGAAGRLSRPAC